MSAQAKTGVEVERLPELPPFSQLIGHMLRDYVPATVETQVAVAIRAYAKAYATASLAAERAEAVRVREENEKLREALEEIALAGMSPSPEMSQNGVEAWHARQAWRFIGIAARAISPIPAALSPSQQGEPR